MINRNRFLNIKQLVIDPDREYLKLCEKLDGTIIKFGATQIINVFDIRETSLEEGESFLRNKISKLNIFFSLIFDGINDEESYCKYDTFSVVCSRFSGYFISSKFCVKA